MHFLRKGSDSIAVFGHLSTDFTCTCLKHCSTSFLSSYERIVSQHTSKSQYILRNIFLFMKDFPCNEGFDMVR
nr:MAG TPA: hypothetical protein [Caudoviricetes sp.]